MILKNPHFSVAAALTVFLGAACGSGDMQQPDDTPDARVAIPAAATTPDAPPDESCPVPTGGPTIHNAADLRTSETWAANGSPHIVNGAIRVLDGQTLTIEACAELRLAKDVVIIAGFGGTPSKIRALGTARRPITVGQKVAGERFDGLEAWYPASLELAHVTVAGGGANRFRRGASITGWGDSALPVKPILKLDHVTVEDSAGMGVLLERNGTFMAGSTALTVTGSGVENGGEGEAVRLDTVAAGDMPDGTFTGNALDSVTLYGSNVDAPIVLDDPGVPFRVSSGSSLVVRTGGSLDLGPGVVLQLGANSYIDVRGGSLTTSGTADEPVKITARDGERWQSLVATWPGTLSLTHTLLENGGSDRFVSYASLVVRGDSLAPVKKMVHVDHVTIKSSGGVGFLVERYAAFDDSSTELTVTASGASQPEGGQAGRIAQPAVYSLPVGTYTGNAIDEIIIDTTQNIVDSERFPFRGVPYAPTGSVVVRNPAREILASLTIEPGVTLKFKKGLFGVQIGAGATGSEPWPGQLVAEGTAAQPITFTSQEAVPAAGDWRGIYFQGYRPTGNVIKHARIEYAGADCLCSVGGCAGAEEAGVMFFLYPLTEAVVSQSTFANIAGHGIYSNFRSDATNLDMTIDNTFEGVTRCAQTMIVSSTGSCARECM